MKGTPVQITAQRLRRTLAASSVAAVLALTAACGSDDGSDDSSSSSGSGDSSDTGEASELTQDEFGQAILTAMKDAGSFSFTMTSSNTANGAETKTTAEGETEIDGEEVDSTMSMEVAEGQTMEVVMVDGDTYIKGTGQLDTKGKYFKVGPAAKGLWSLMGSSPSPADSLRVYDDPTSFKAVGHEDVDGVDTVHYEIGISRDAYLDGLGDDSPLAKMGDMAAKMLPKTVNAEVWVDGDNQVRKTTNSLEINAMGQKATTSTEMEMTDYGKDFDIEAPSSDELTDVDPLKGLMPS